MSLNCGAEKTLESPLDSKKIKPVNPKRNQPWIFTGRTDAEAEAPILWPPDVKSQHTGKDPDSEKNWRREEKGTTENEMVGWHHRLNGHEFEQTLGDSGGQRSLACYSPWGRKESGHNLATEQQNCRILQVLVGKAPWVHPEPNKNQKAYILPQCTAIRNRVELGLRWGWYCIEFLQISGYCLD